VACIVAKGLDPATTNPGNPTDLGQEGEQAGASSLQRKAAMVRKQYDFSQAKRNPYAKRLKKPITIRLDQQTIDDFKRLADETGVPYQTPINLYLRDCAATGRKLTMRWWSSA
jgi:uncharacterized protein (DUF4415 family)